jgi:hypothetical protein
LVLLVCEWTDLVINDNGNGFSYSSLFPPSNDNGGSCFSEYIMHFVKVTLESKLGVSVACDKNPFRISLGPFHRWQQVTKSAVNFGFLFINNK